MTYHHPKPGSKIADIAAAATRPTVLLDKRVELPGLLEASTFGVMGGWGGAFSLPFISPTGRPPIDVVDVTPNKVAVGAPKAAVLTIGVGCTCDTVLPVATGCTGEPDETTR